MKKGDKIRYTGNNLGTMKEPHDRQFTGVVVKSGDSGVYCERFKGELGREGWHLTKVVPQDLYVPVHESQFEVAP